MNWVAIRAGALALGLVISSAAVAQPPEDANSVVNGESVSLTNALVGGSGQTDDGDREVIVAAVEAGDVNTVVARGGRPQDALAAGLNRADPLERSLFQRVADRAQQAGGRLAYIRMPTGAAGLAVVENGVIGAAFSVNLGALPPDALDGDVVLRQGAAPVVLPARWE